MSIAMLTYECTECGAKLERCGCCWNLLHPAQIKSQNGSEVFCATCTIIVRNLPAELPVIQVQ